MRPRVVALCIVHPRPKRLRPASRTPVRSFAFGRPDRRSDVAIPVAKLAKFKRGVESMAWRASAGPAKSSEIGRKAPGILVSQILGCTPDRRPVGETLKIRNPRALLRAVHAWLRAFSGSEFQPAKITVPRTATTNRGIAVPAHKTCWISLLFGQTAPISAPSSSGSRDEPNKKEWAKNPLFSFFGKPAGPNSRDQDPRDRTAASN